MQLNRNSYQEQLWNQSPETDAHRSRPRNVVEAREHNSAIAFVKGPREFARELMESQLSDNSCEASRQLIESSRQLLAQSRRLIVATRNTLVFARGVAKQVN
jgi:hypothetical protein